MEFTLKPVGYFSCEQSEAYHSPRQGHLHSNKGVLKLLPQHNFEQALQNLEGVSHIWIIYIFHHNQSWKPLVQTPRSEQKIGLFATRAPYRPNPIGISCVKIERIKGLEIHVCQHDLLDGTPILDIKPYLESADSIEDSHIDWIDQLKPAYTITESANFTKQANWLMDQAQRDTNLSLLRQFIVNQLQYDPLNNKKKRLKETTDGYSIAYRTWRIHFQIISDTKIELSHIESGYSHSELQDPSDKYFDKQIHKEFQALF